MELDNQRLLLWDSFSNVCETCWRREPRGPEVYQAEVKALKNYFVRIPLVCPRCKAEAEAQIIEIMEGANQTRFVCVECGYNEALPHERNDNRRPARATAWAMKVKERDGYKCQECGSKKNLEAHHIIPWAECTYEQKYDLNNGITLCRSCHDKVHQWRAGKNWSA